MSETINEFAEENSQDGLRVFVAGGSRSGYDEIYAEEAYNLGRQIIKMNLKLDFGLSNSGIMGAVARGVIDGCKKYFKDEKSPIQGITTKEYYELYPRDDDLINKIGYVIVAQTLEERKQKLLDADFVVFAPGGVGTLDELAYDCVAMQDGLLPIKPFILYNIEGFFYHILEYLKHMAAKGFADPMPFIVVDNSKEVEIVFRMLKLRYTQSKNFRETYENVRQLIYELPYFIKKKEEHHIFVEDIIAHIDNIREYGSDKQKAGLNYEIEQAYLEKEIERLHERLAKTGCITSVIGDKLTKLKKRKKK
jgi:uncharacterized protein (TIGR00730 family)